MKQNLENLLDLVGQESWRETRRLAFLGDRVFEFILSEMLFQEYPTATCGELSLRKQRYCTNFAMATFLRSATDAAQRINPLLNEHDCGTILEAFFAASYEVGAVHPLSQFLLFGSFVLLPLFSFSFSFFLLLFSASFFLLRSSSSLFGHHGHL
jgi:hypothetical protein